MANSGDRMLFSVASLGEEPTDRYADLARLCELLGFEGIFHVDEKWTRDVYVRQGYVAAITKRLRLGISVTDPFTRHPALTAQATASLSEASGGRLTVVMGKGSHFETLPDIKIERPIAAMREAIQVMRGMWRGKRVYLDGEIIHLDGAVLDFPLDIAPKLWVAGRGPQVLRLAGEVADGVLMGSFATETGVNYAREEISKGLERSGREWSDITLALWVYVAILDYEDEPIPDDALRGVSHALWSSREFFAKHLDDFADDISDEFRKFMNEAPHEWSPEIMSELRRLIPQGIFDSLAVVGTEAKVIERFEALRKVGVQHCVIWPFPRPSEAVEDLTVRMARSLLLGIADSRGLADYQRVD